MKFTCFFTLQISSPLPVCPPLISAHHPIALLYRPAKSKAADSAAGSSKGEHKRFQDDDEDEDDGVSSKGKRSRLHSHAGSSVSGDAAVFASKYFQPAALAKGPVQVAVLNGAPRIGRLPDASVQDFLQKHFYGDRLRRQDALLNTRNRKLGPAKLFVRR